MSGWVWLVAAVALAAAEVVLPGFILLGFAVGAAVVGLILLVGGPLALWLSASIPALVLVFALVSVAAWLGLRRWGRGRAAETFDYDVNDTLPGEERKD